MYLIYKLSNLRHFYFDDIDLIKYKNQFPTSKLLQQIFDEAFVSNFDSND